MTNHMGRGVSLVYFLYSETFKSVKIGTTWNYYGRLVTLRSQYGSLSYLGGVEGGREIEQPIQKRFAHIRNYKMPGVEWFHDTPELRDYIGLNAKLGEPDHVPYRTNLTVSPQVAKRLKEFAQGLGVSPDLALLFLLKQVCALGSSENPLLEGVRLREDFKASPHNKEGRKRSKSPDGE